MATNIGSVLLPTINVVVSYMGKVANKFANFAEKNPQLTKTIGLVVAGLLSAKIACFGLRYAFTFIASPFLNTLVLFNKIRTGLSLMQIGFGGGIPKILGSLKILSKFLFSSPIGLIIGGIALGAVLLIKYWKPISTFFKNVFDPVIVIFQEVWNWVSKVWNKTAEVFGGIKEWVSDSVIGKAWNWTFGDEKEKNNDKKKSKEIKKSDGVNIGQTMFEPKENQFFNNNNYVESPKAKGNQQNNININAPITINAASSMNEKQIAAQIDLMLKKYKEDAKRRQRGLNYD